MSKYLGLTVFFHFTQMCYIDVVNFNCAEHFKSNKYKLHPGCEGYMYMNSTGWLLRFK